MSNNKDFKVKNGIQPTSYYEGVGTVVSGSEGYSLASASYDSVSFSVASQDTTPFSIFFKPDGTKLYLLGYGTDTVYQYSLSTAWDISTLSYASKSFSVTSQDTTPYQVVFKSDGTKMYMVGTTSDSLYQYSLSTAWDVSTASYDSVSFSFASQDTASTAVWFKDDGTKVYMYGQTTNDFYQYSLSTAWEVSTLSYDSVSYAATSAETGNRNMVIVNSGYTLFTVGADTDTIYKHVLSTAWDLSTASYSGESFSVASQENNPAGMAIKTDGTKMYIVGITNDTIFQYSTVLTTNSLDLSTGSVFEVTPTSDIQVTLSNPADSGTVSQATLLLGSEDSTGVSSAFSTTLYTGNATARDIDNGIDLSGDGGLVWIKSRSTTGHHHLADTERGGNKWLYSNLTQGQDTVAYIPSFYSNGFSLNTSAAINANGTTYAAWTFKKQAKFFDVVTWTGNGQSTQTIPHNLGSAPGFITIKATGVTQSWWSYHRSLGTGKYIKLETNGAAVSGSIVTATSDSDFTVGSTTTSTGYEYVAYVFAHDTDASSIIKCGSYTGNGSTTGPEIDLGFEPQWVMIKEVDATGNWQLFDSMRGMVANGIDARIAPNENSAEDSIQSLTPTATGFKINTTSGNLNTNTSDHIYMAISNLSVPTITYDPTLEWPSGTAPTSPAIGETDVMTFSTTDGGTTYSAVQAIDGAK